MTTPEIPVAEIFSQGEEVVSGQIADTNAAWLSQELLDLGFDIARHTAVGDRLPALRDLLLEIAGRADCCICTGGLGPTQDDLTAEAVAAAFGLELRMDPVALKSIEERYSRTGTPMPEVNRKQALLPAGSLRLDNHWGTAPGFALRVDRCWFAFLPGVPVEMRGMFRQGVMPELQTRFALPRRKRITLRCFGIGESALQERLDRLPLSPELAVGFRVAVPEVHLKLLFPAHWENEAIRTEVAAIRHGLGDEVFAIDGLEGEGNALAQSLGKLLQARNATLAAAESASGGLIASQCAGEPWFLYSIVIPDLLRLLGHSGSSSACLDAETAVRLATALRQDSGADYAVANFVLEKETPPLVHCALATAEGTLHLSRPASSVKERAQVMAAAHTLDLLRRHLQGLIP